MMGLPDGRKSFKIGSRLDTIPDVTVGRTDGHVALAKTALAFVILSC